MQIETSILVQCDESKHHLLRYIKSPLVRLNPSLLSLVPVGKSGEIGNVEDYLKMLINGFPGAVTSRKCSSNGCNSNTCNFEKLTFLPKIIAIETNCDDKGHSTHADKFYWPTEMDVFDRKYILKGRIVATSLSGGHFFALVHRKEPSEGVYMHDGMVNQGYASRCVNKNNFEGRNVYSNLGFYVQEE
jgi:hypothetical protein